MTSDGYTEIHARHRWQVPAQFNIAHACATRWANDRARFALYWDASGSGAQQDRARIWALLDRYFKAVGSGEVTLIVFRDRAEAPRRFPIAGGDSKKLKAALEALACPDDLPNELALAKTVNNLLALEGPSEYDQYHDPNWHANLKTYQMALYNGAKADPALAPLSETAAVGSLPAVLVPLLLQYVVDPFVFTSANLNCPLPLKFVDPTRTRP